MNRNSKVFRILNGPVMFGGFPVPEGIKPYNIVTNEDEDTVEIDMYGEVVQSRPTDWWTGEPIDGLYIVLNEFLNDLGNIKNKSNVTFRINSPGGDLYAGVSIYNRIKEMTGHTETICDGLAASAASIILQAGDTRKVCNGTQVMIHGASSFIYGTYNIQDLKQSIQTLEAANNSVIDIYAETTGKTKEQLKSMIAKTTWMNAEDAVSNGFADEIMQTENKVTMSMAQDSRLLYVNGIPMNTMGFGKLPEGVAVANSMVPAVGNKHTDNINRTKNKEEGNKTMTKEELMQQYPELINQIRNEVIQEAKNGMQESIENAVTAERERIKGIEDIQNVIADRTMIENAKYGEIPCTAQELAFKAMQQQAQLGATFLTNMETDARNSGADGVSASPNQGTQTPKDQAKQDIADGAALIAGAFKQK